MLKYCGIIEAQEGGSLLYPENLKEWKRKRSRSKKETVKLEDKHTGSLNIPFRHYSCHLRHDHGSYMTRGQVESKREKTET